MYDIEKVRAEGERFDTWKELSGSRYSNYRYGDKIVTVHEDDDEVIAVFGDFSAKPVEVWYIHPSDVRRFVMLNKALFIRGEWVYRGEDNNARVLVARLKSIKAN